MWGKRETKQRVCKYVQCCKTKHTCLHMDQWRASNSNKNLQSLVRNGRTSICYNPNKTKSINRSEETADQQAVIQELRLFSKPHAYYRCTQILCRPMYSQLSKSITTRHVSSGSKSSVRHIPHTIIVPGSLQERTVGRISTYKLSRKNLRCDEFWNLRKNLVCTRYVIKVLKPKVPNLSGV